ncbi:MAG: hypothetical protein A2V63_08020 [Candidatus Eisenbacteria bacterium RBG_19FT_COMBO_70_11]|nr:MAG: hypothetical protein A2V63_08020 [Candidatus Eisenbacteria bacterium RBG_19FT_COMBO_70_11]
MSKDGSGSTARLIQLCIGYFLSYVATGVLVKYFLNIRQPPFLEMGYLFNNTVGGSAFALGLVILLGWIRLKSNRLVQWGPWKVPSEVAYILPSGICTAVVIPTTTLMYSLPISVMVAMVIMRGSVIVISRAVDALQIRQGILTKRVYAEENWAVVFALLAVATNVLLLPLVAFLGGHGLKLGPLIGIDPAAARGSFDFLHSGAAMAILGSYIVAYSLRIYIMNYFKNTRGKGVPQDNRGFFAIEQIAASFTMLIGGVFIFGSPSLLGWTDARILEFRQAVMSPSPIAVLSGIPFGIVAFFSVFIFMFKGRTATFAGLVNRLTSLLAGTTATLLMHYLFGLRLPSVQDWASVFFIMVAVYFLSIAERKRIVELALAREGAAAAGDAA